MIRSRGLEELSLCHNARKPAVLLILQVNKIITRTFLQLPQILRVVNGGTNSQNMNEGKEILKFD